MFIYVLHIFFLSSGLKSIRIFDEFQFDANRQYRYVYIYTHMD